MYADIPAAPLPDIDGWSSFYGRGIPTEIMVNGVRVSGATVVSLISTLTNPDPRRWYRFERKGDVIHVETKTAD